MRRPLVLLALGGLALATFATGPASAAGPTGSTGAKLTGAQEVPPADPDGSGQAAVALDARVNRVCYALQVSNIAPATAAHIHFGVAGTNGPVVVHFLPPTRGSSGGCTTSIAPGVVQKIIDNPAAYYVNIHNAQYPGGAVRGQLVGAQSPPTTPPPTTIGS